MNRVVVVTGASRGLGLCLAKHFIQDGDVVLGISKTKKHWHSARRFVNEPSCFLLYSADLTDERQVRLFYATLRREIRRIDILINNAGIAAALKRVERTSLKELQADLSANLISQFLMCKHALPFFQKQQKGLMINISSMAGKRAVPKLFPYSASKFAVLALSQCIAKENEAFGVKCITVCPGGMNTSMRAKLFGKADAARQQTPDYVARVILDIANDRVSVASGGDIVIRHGKITAINPAPKA